MKANIQIVAFMTPFPYSVDVDDPLSQAHQLMREHHFPAAVVVKGSKLVGIFTVTDACRALADALRGPSSESHDAA